MQPLVFLHNRIESVVVPVSRFFDKISWIVLFAMMMLTVVDVLMRKLFARSVLGTVEITELMMVIVVFLAFTQTELENGHIRIDLVMSRFSKKVQAFSQLLTQTACAVLFGIMAVSTYRYAVDMMGSGEVTMTLKIPIYPFDFVIVVGYACITLALICKSLAALCEVMKNES
jgi:TRAP-type C4-dicarboxylate transport system permease small subunit